jgi:hypothetical protein
MNRTVSRGLRTLLQLVAAGGLTALINAVAEGLPGNVKAIVLAVSALAVTVAQNLLEAHDVIAPVLESPPATASPTGWVERRKATDERFER